MAEAGRARQVRVLGRARQAEGTDVTLMWASRDHQSLLCADRMKQMVIAVANWGSAKSIVDDYFKK